jgi:hypothetical protein
MAHVWGEVGQFPEGQMQTSAADVEMLSESPEVQANVGWTEGFALKNPLRLEELRVGVKPVGSSWRGRLAAAVSYGLRRRLSCLHVKMCPRALEAANAYWKRAMMESCLRASDGRSDQTACGRPERVREPCMY